MATLSELRMSIIDTIQDFSFVDSVIDALLNGCINKIAGGMPSTLGNIITPPLPDLFTIDTVETVTDAAFVSMPAPYQRNLQFATNSNETPIDIYNSMITFSEDYPLMNSSGNVAAAIEQGGNFYYQKIPTSPATVTIHFFRLPVAMSIGSDVPDGIPLHLQESLLINYVCWKIFELKDTNKDKKPNSTYYEMLFKQELKTLELNIPQDGRSLVLSGD